MYAEAMFLICVHNTIFSNLKLLKSIDKKLNKLYVRYVNDEGYCAVLNQILYHEGVNIMLLVKEMSNPDTGGKVKGFFRYGIEIHPDDSNFFIIHKINT